MKGFFSIEIATPRSAPAGLAITQEEWESMSPGMRRAIARDFTPPALPFPPAQTLQERKREVEYAGRKRL